MEGNNWVWYQQRQPNRKTWERDKGDPAKTLRSQRGCTCAWAAPSAEWSQRRLWRGSVQWMCESPSHLRLSVTPWAVTSQAPLSMEPSRQEHWSEEPVPSPGDLSWLRDWTANPALQADSALSEPPGKLGGDGLHSNGPTESLNNWRSKATIKTRFQR